MKVLYACAICEKNLYVKCPFCVKQKMHVIPNNRGLLNGIVEESFIDCIHCHTNVIVVNDGTRRIKLKQNKSKTSYLLDKKSIRRQECLFKIERAKYILDKDLVLEPHSNNWVIPCPELEITIVDTCDD